MPRPRPPSASPPAATLTVVVVLAGMFAVEAARGAVGDETALLGMGALPNGGGLDHQYWRLVTYSLLHLDYLHLCLNLALLWWVGSIVERRIGSAALGAVYFVSVVAAGIAITVAHAGHPRPGSSLGASGGIFGLLACALILLHRRDASRFGQNGRVRIFLWVILAGGIVASLLPGVSLAGHAAGLVTGLLAGWWVPLLP